ncbi:uncharacterized protein KY384_008030 [Bacidia gigantensis]|uniref:uncharacterized protein n=1 Tax=Bacidia gigantensis TaxID=2732470 RepID=UPI001D03B9D2|nr:uncharacterized protein KY384_008030 [Bacidia gigantensis]KAG8527286.1 hypothetical protein KY384_008030 [Bacidia gigantensis]
MSRYAYRWKDADKAMIRIDSPSMQPSQHVHASPNAALDSLATLPLEILHDILSILDFQTLTTLRSLSNASCNIVDSVPAYQTLTTYALPTLQSLARTRLLPYFSANHLHTALLNDRCTNCGDFGCFLFLPTCSRACYICLDHSARFRVVEKATAARLFSLSKANFSALPTLLSLPGAYGISPGYSRKQRIKLVSAFQAFKASDIARAILENDGVNHLDTDQILLSATAQALRTNNREDTENAASHNLHINIESLLSRSDWFGFTSTTFPTLNVTTSQCQDGLYCVGCRAQPKGLIKIRGKRKASRKLSKRWTQRAYSAEEFSQHMQKCRWLQWIMEQDRKGGRGQKCGGRLIVGAPMIGSLELSGNTALDHVADAYLHTSSTAPRHVTLAPTKAVQDDLSPCNPHCTTFTLCHSYIPQVPFSTILSDILCFSFNFSVTNATFALPSALLMSPALRRMHGFHSP